MFGGWARSVVGVTEAQKVVFVFISMLRCCFVRVLCYHSIALPLRYHIPNTKWKGSIGQRTPPLTEPPSSLQSLDPKMSCMRVPKQSGEGKNIGHPPLEN
jgi:hypothetical protein